MNKLTTLNAMRSAASIAALTALAALGGCGSDNRKTEVVAVLHNLAETFFKTMATNASDEGEALKAQLSIIDGKGDAAKQVADVEAAVSANANGLILAPSDAEAIKPAVEKAIAAGVSVITVDRRIEGVSKPVPHVGVDNVAGGGAMAQYVVDRFPQGARVVILTGNEKSTSAIDRTTGIHQALDPVKDRYPIVRQTSAEWNRDRARTVVDEILKSGADRPNAIIAENDDMALGAVDALRSAGITGVAVLGYDAQPETLKLIRDGVIAGTVEQSPSRQIRTALDQLAANARKNTPILGAKLRPILITQENLTQAERLSEVN